MRVLITGADGRLARAVMAALHAEASIVALDTQFTTLLPPGVERYVGELCDAQLVATALDGVDAVLHLAPMRSSAADELSQLDEATRGSYVLLTTALDMDVRKFVIGSTLALFDQLPAEWDVDEFWRPRPMPSIAHLRAWLAELSAREVTRATNACRVCLRFGELVDDVEAAAQPYDPRWLHIDDAVAGVRCALRFDAPGWSVFHITAAGQGAKVRLAAAGQASFGYQPAHDLRARWSDQLQPQCLRLQHRAALQAVLAPKEPISSRPLRRVVMFGAGGPLAAAAAAELATSYRLRLTDIKPIAEIAAAGPRSDQGPGAPLPVPLQAPHECQIVDVTDPEQVLPACAGMDAIINCTVIRNDPIAAFKVNTLGAYNVVRAAVAHGIRRILHTGPQLITLHGAGDYLPDYDIPADAPPRPGRHLYGHSKYLGQEICRVFADYYGLEIPVLLFSSFVQPATGQPRPLYPFAVSWQDAARAVRRALEVKALPSPYEVFHISTDLPHGKVCNRKAKDVLG